MREPAGQTGLTMETLMRRIGMSPEMAACAEGIVLSGQEYDTYRRQFDADREGFFTRVRTEHKDYRPFFLKWYLLLALEAHSWYREKGISDRIYFDTCRDITYWTQNCMRDRGEIGIEQYDWLWRHVTGKLYRLGRLEYEIVKGEEEPALNGRQVAAGETVLNLHIPQGEPLLLEGCLLSLKQAAAFFQDYREITCHSWLLAPALQRLLPAESNILRFQTLFEIYRLDPESREAEERVFHRLREAPAEYPEETSLQRALKRLLVKGGKAGSAYGRVKEFMYL